MITKQLMNLRLQRGEIKSQYFDASGEDIMIYNQTIENEEAEENKEAE